MEFHKYANLFPMMDKESFASLVSDIQENGLLEPIVIYDEKILDGRNRYKACVELGIEPRYERVNGNTDPLKYVISKNLQRRHLNETQRAGVAARLANLGWGQRADRAANLPLSPVTQASAAEMLNVGERTLRTYKAVAEAAPELVPLMDSGEMTANEARKRVREMLKLENNVELTKLAETVKVSDRWNVFAGDIHEVELETNSLDAIITDPPYPQDSLPLWAELGRFAKRHLKEGGVLLAMTGNLYLPQILEMLGENLTYQWQLACELPGQHSEVHAAWVNNQMWKPVLVYRNGGKLVNIGSDLFQNDGRDKKFHEWGQGVGGYLWQIEHFTKPNDLICDPFLGGGTTAVASLKLKRRFVGFDVDPEKVAISKGRISKELD